MTVIILEIPASAIPKCAELTILGRSTRGQGCPHSWRKACLPERVSNLRASYWQSNTTRLVWLREKLMNCHERTQRTQRGKGWETEIDSPVCPVGVKQPVSLRLCVLCDPSWQKTSGESPRKNAENTKGKRLGNRN